MKVLCLLSLIFSTSLCFAQRQNVYFLKNNGNYVTIRDSADFIRIVREPDSASVLFNVVEYYQNGKTKRVGKSSTVEPLKLEGACISYYKNGNKENICNYKNGNQAGSEFDFYPNGKIYLVKEFVDHHENKLQGDKNYLIKESNDSLGTALIKEGYGHYIGYNDTFTEIIEEGSIKNGLRDSLWKGEYKNRHTIFRETYDKGELVSGTATFEDGQTSTYTKSRNVPPQFKGGLDNFGRYLSRNIRYPKEAVQLGIKGRVVLSFVVEKNGQIADLKVSKSVNYYLDAEAVRVLQESPLWIPGTQFGRPVRVQYSVPIAFSL